MRRLRTLAAALLLAGPLTLAGCAPSLSAPAAPQEEQPGGPLLETARSAAEEPARDTAITILHRMKLGRLEAGSCTSNVLEDLTDLHGGIAFFMDASPWEPLEQRVLEV